MGNMIEGLLLTGAIIVGLVVSIIFAHSLIGIFRPESRDFMTKQSEIIAGIIRKSKK